MIYMVRVSCLRALCLLLLPTCIQTSFAQETKESAWAPPTIEKSISIRDGRTGERKTWEQLINDVSQADVVFLGETHDDDTTHRLEFEVYQGVMQKRDSKSVLAMEMFERDTQSALDDYLAAKINEETFLTRARPWANYHEAYRPMVEFAKAAGGKVVASNFPRPLRMEVSSAGAAAFEKLGANRHWAPAKLMANSDYYWKRTDNAVRGHLMMMGGGNSPEERLISTQSLWDNTMGESCVLALEANPGHSVVHVNGGFHTEYWDGTANQVKLRKPDAKIKTISIAPAQNPNSARLTGAPVADYVVFVENKSKNLNDGSWSVVVNQKQKFKLHVPNSASLEHPVPLLIVLSDDGLGADDGLDLWRVGLADHAAIVAIDAPMRQQQLDLSMGGQWYWADSFSDDIGVSVEAVERTWQYVLNRYPIDPTRVCLVGEGSGATVAAAVTLLTNRMDVSTLAINPKTYTKIKDFPLPLPEEWGQHTPPKRHLTVFGNETDQTWWSSELAEYETVGLPTKFSVNTNDPWSTDNEIRRLLKTTLNASMSEVGKGKAYVSVTSDSPRARHWAALAAKRNSNDAQHCIVWNEQNPPSGDATAIEQTVTVENTANSLPLCPGPFGGTTVLVLPASTSEGDLKKWLALETNDPLTMRSRFHRLRIATESDGENGLATVLQRLHEKNRNNVLIVPAEFCATPQTMRKLLEMARPTEDQMTLQWSPGLGGGLK